MASPEAAESPEAAVAALDTAEDPLEAAAATTAAAAAAAAAAGAFPLLAAPPPFLSLFSLFSLIMLRRTEGIPFQTASD